MVDEENRVHGPHDAYKQEPKILKGYTANAVLMTTPGNFRPQPPEPFLERRLGHQIHAAESPLRAEILDFLSGAPRSRYRDMRQLLRGRGDQVLTDALSWLQEKGILHKYGVTQGRSEYQLTTLGVAVRDVIVELRAYDRNSLAARDPEPPATSPA